MIYHWEIQCHWKDSVGRWFDLWGETSQDSWVCQSSHLQQGYQVLQSSVEPPHGGWSHLGTRGRIAERPPSPIFYPTRISRARFILRGVVCNIPNFNFGMLYPRSSLHIIFIAFWLILEIFRNSRTLGESWGFRYFHIWVVSNFENRIFWFYLFYLQLFLLQK